MEAINYPYMVGVLSAKMSMIGYRLREQGLIKHEDIEKVDEYIQSVYNDAERVAKEYYAEVNKG